MSKARRHRRVTLIMRNGFPLGVNPLDLSHHCRGLMYSRPKGITLDADPAVIETAWPWVTGLLWLSWLWWESTRSEQGTTVPASWSNPTPRLDKWFSVMETAHFYLRFALTPTLSSERERHLDVEPPSALNELKSTNRRCNWVYVCSGVAEEPGQHPRTSWKFGVRVLGRREEPDIGKLCPLKQTSGTSCDSCGEALSFATIPGGKKWEKHSRETVAPWSSGRVGDLQRALRRDRHRVMRCTPLFPSSGRPQESWDVNVRTASLRTS